LFTGKPNILVQVNHGNGLDQTWSAYKYGFSDSNGGYWLGLENGHLMTNNGKNWKVCIDGQDELGTWLMVAYQQFVVDSESAGYTFFVTGVTGSSYDFFGSTSRKYKFSTKDVNNQPCCCAEQAASCKGGWWYSCTTSMTTVTVILNGAGKCGFSYSVPFGPPIQLRHSYMRMNQA